MSETPLLGLPILEAAQAQKHVTHNEALLLLDAAIHLSVISRVVAVPPSSPLDGDRYLIAPGPSGLWVAQAGKLAFRQSGSWLFGTPRKGWRVWIEDEEKFLVFDGALWRDLSVSGGDKGDIRIGAGGVWLAERTGGAVGDGVADDAAALQSVLAAGKSVILNSTKTYRITQRLDITVDGTGIEGNGATVIMSTASGHFDNATYGNRTGADAIGIYAVGVDRPFVRNCRITTSAWVDNIYLAPIRMDSCTDIDISGNEIHGFSRSFAIWLDDITGGKISHNYIHDNYTNSTASNPFIVGIEVDDGCLVGSSGLLIDGNRIHNLTQGEISRAALGWQSDAIGLKGAIAKATNNCRVVNNDFYNVGEGVDCYGRNNVIAQNTVTRAFGAAIKLAAGARRNALAHNIIEDTGLAAIYLVPSSSALITENVDGN